MAKKTISFLVVCFGLLLILFSVASDLIGFGDGVQLGTVQIMGIIIGAAMAAGGAALFRRLPGRVNTSGLALFAVSSILSMVLLEVLLRIFLAPPPDIISVDGPKAELYGWVLLPNAEAMIPDPDTGEPMHYTTNSQGWKDVEHSFEKPPDTLRILFLGDSATFGIVAAGDEYHRLVEEILRERGYAQIEVIALGMWGWGSDQLLEVLTVEGVLYNPDIVIYQFTGNDVINNVQPLPDLPHTRYEWAKRFRYDVDDTDLSLTRIELQPSVVKDDREFLQRSQVFSHVRLAFNQAANLFQAQQEGSEWQPEYPVYVVPMDPTDPLFVMHSPDVENTPELSTAYALIEAIIVEMKEVSEAHGAEFILYSQDGEDGGRDWHVGAGLFLSDDQGDYLLAGDQHYIVDVGRTNLELERIAARHDIPLIVPTRRYDRYRYDPHPNKEGNLNMALDIVDFLLDWEPFVQLAADTEAN